MSAARHTQTGDHPVQTAIFFVLSVIGVTTLGLYQLGLTDDTVDMVGDHPGAVAFVATLISLAILAVWYAVHPRGARVDTQNYAGTLERDPAVQAQLLTETHARF